MNSSAEFSSVRPVDLGRRKNPAARFMTLWGAWALLLAAAMIVGNLAGGHSSTVATALRMSSSVVLVAVVSVMRIS